MMLPALLLMIVRLSSSSSVDGSDLVCSEAERLTAGNDEEMLRIHSRFFIFFSFRDVPTSNCVQCSRLRRVIM